MTPRKPDGGFWYIFVDLWGGLGLRSWLARSRRSERQYWNAIERDADRLRASNGRLQEGLPPPSDQDAAPK